MEKMAALCCSLYWQELMNGTVTSYATSLVESLKNEEDNDPMDLIDDTAEDDSDSDLDQTQNVDGNQELQEYGPTQGNASVLDGSMSDIKLSA